MKSKIVRLFLPIVIAIPLIGASPSKPIPQVSFDCIGPYDIYQEENPNFTFSVKNTKTSGAIYDIKVWFGDNYVPNRRAYNNINVGFTAGQTRNYTVSIPTDMCLSEEGMIITFIIHDKTTDNELLRKTVTLCPRTRETINPLYLEDSIYESEAVVVEMSKNTPSYDWDEYNFSDYLDYFLADTYFRLPIEQFNFAYKNKEGTDLEYDSANLIVNGGNQFFPGLNYDNGKAIIPLSIERNGYNLYELKYKNQLYVDKRLLIISTSPREGFVATNHFFFPVNHAKDLEGITFSFEILGAGYNKTNFIWDSSFLAVNPLIGDCQDSEYCIVGEVKK